MQPYSCLNNTVDDTELDQLLHALGDATRRRLLDHLRDAPGLTLSALGEGFEQSRQAISKHLAVLAAADLVVTLWRGREKLHYLNPVPLQALPARWVTTTARAHSAALVALRRAMAPAGDPAAAALAPKADLSRRLAAAPLAAWMSGRADSFVAPAARRSALAYLADTASLVGSLRQAMADAQGYAPPRAGGFSLVQHLWHLADVEQQGWALRFGRLLNETNPVLPGVDGDRLAREGRYQQRPWRAAARRFEAQRRRTLQALTHCDAAVLRRPVRFSGQPATGVEMLAAMLAHDHGHRSEMAALWPPA